MQPTTRGPVRPAERSLAPDLARGVALLGIALANSVLHLHGRQLGPGFRPVDGSTADRVVDALVGTLVDNRAFPMFTLLFGYGLAVVLRRQAQHGTPWPQARNLLLRRCGWLAVFGLAHMVLLYDGDILLVYGLLGLALVAVLRLPCRALGWIAVAALVPLAGFASVDGLPDATSLLQTEEGVVAALGARALQAGIYVLTAPFLVLGFVAPAVVGVLLARRGVLEQPSAHVPLLRRLVVGGFCVSVPGALPMVLASLQFWQPSTPTGLLLGAVHGVTGVAGGVAFVALVALVAAHFQRGGGRGEAGMRGWPLRAVVAVGQRSLTCYLLQSLLLVPLMAAWAGGLGRDAGTAFAAALGTGAYLVGVAVAITLDRAGQLGPAERLLRRLTYGARTADEALDRQSLAVRT